MPELSERMAVIERCVDEHDHLLNGNGRPGLRDLESKLMRELGIVQGAISAQVEQVKDHGRKNDAQVSIDLKHLIDGEASSRKTDKAEILQGQKDMGTKIDRMTLVFGSLAGAVTIIETLEKMGVIHFAR